MQQNQHSNVDTDTARRLLAQERKELEEILHAREQEALEETERESFQDLATADQHNADLGSETFQREKAESIRLSIEGRLADIDDAYDKLDKGEYGICEVCRRPIPEERLKARPETRYCAQDAAQLARNGTGSP